MAQASPQSVARRYAEALFELALESQQTVLLRQELDSLADLLKQNQDLRDFIFSAAIHSNHKAKMIDRVFTSQLSELAMKFLQVVVAKERANLLLEIIKEFTVIEDEHAGRVQGTLITAIHLEPKDIAEYAQQIGQSIQKTVTLNNRVDPTILGGSILIMGEQVWDNSVQTNLHRFSQRLRTVGELKMPTP